MSVTTMCSAAVAIALMFVAACARQPKSPVVLVIDGMEYAFQAPDTVDPGPTVLQLRNTGSVRHEVIVLKLRTTATVNDLVSAQARDETMRPYIEGGSAVAFADPGTTGSAELVVDFDPGRDYVLWCNFRDADGKPTHSTLGMFKRIHVRAASAPAPAPVIAARQVLIDGADYAFRVADTIAAGPADIRFRNIGRQRHELAFSRIKAGTSAEFFFSEMNANHDVDSLFDDDGAILTVYGGDFLMMLFFLLAD